MPADAYNPTTLGAAATTQLLRGVPDLTSTSVALERVALGAGLGPAFTRRPSRLLADFIFPPGLRAVELGSGTGAVTRLLGERCAFVHALAASNDALALTGERTRDQAQVAIRLLTNWQPAAHAPPNLLVCADSQLDRHGHLLAPGGLELSGGASQLLGKAGTLIAAASLEQAGPEGLAALRARLAEQFARVAMYFPYPDHRQPDCLLAEAFFDRVDARELVASYAADDAQRVRICESPATALPDYANGVLIVADDGHGAAPRFPQLGVMYGRRRPAAPHLETRTRFVAAGINGVRTLKTHLGATATSRCGRLMHRDCADAWMTGLSLQETLLRRARDPDRSLADIFQPARAWLQALHQQASHADDIPCLPGHYLDATWQNAFIDDSGQCRFIDLEWQWHRPIPLPVLLIRSISYLLNAAEGRADVDARLRPISRKRLIYAIAGSLGVKLRRRDFTAYQRLDAAFQVILEGGNARHARLYNRLKLRNQALFSLAGATRQTIARMAETLRPGAGEQNSHHPF